jgi:dienelactone hydrolase
MTYTSQPTQLTTRDSIVYTSNGLKIFGVIHRPIDAATAPRSGVVMYHGFVAAKFQPPHRIFVELAEQLARVGIVSLRIDLPGRGDSEGESIDMTVDNDLAAAQKAIDVLSEQPDVDSKRIGLVGISWGGTLAATLAGRDQRVAGTVLWSSAPSATPNWQPDLHDFGGRMAAEVVGNLVGEQFYMSLHQLSPIEDIKRTRGPVLLVYGTNDEVIPSFEIEQAQQQLTEAGIPNTVICIEGADHVFFRHEWQRQVIEHTVAWLRQTLQPNR